MLPTSTSNTRFSVEDILNGNNQELNVNEMECYHQVHQQHTYVLPHEEHQRNNYYGAYNNNNWDQVDKTKEHAIYGQSYGSPVHQLDRVGTSGFQDSRISEDGEYLCKKDSENSL